MRKIVLTFISIFSLFAVSSAQEIKIGLRLGDNTSVLKGDFHETIESSSIRGKFGCGLFLNYKMNENVSVQTEVNYLNKKFEIRTAQGVVGSFIEDISNLNYLEIPFLAKYEIGGRFKGFLNAGPVINVLVSGGDHYYESWGSHTPHITNKTHDNIKSEFNNFTVGILAGAGVEWNFYDNLSLLAEFRVSYDLSKTVKSDSHTFKDREYSNMHFFTTSVSAGIAYKFK